MMSMRRIDFKNLLTLENVIRTFHFRSIKSKTINEMPLLERFVNKMAGLCKSEVPTTQLMERLETIQKFGFNAIEIVEYPEVLKMEKEELHLRLKRISERCQNKPKALVMAKHLKFPVTLKNSLAFEEHCNKSTLDGISAVESLRLALRCSEEKMLDILTRNPRLRTVKKNLDFFEKIKVLFDYGARPEDLWADTTLLNNRTLEVIRDRAKKLHDLGYDDPLPVWHIARAEADYERIMRRLQENTSSKEEVKTHVETLKQIPYVKPNTMHVHKCKLDYLLSEGYTTAEILESPEIFCDSLDTIRRSVEAMKAHYLEKVPLSRCVRHSNGKPDPPRTQRNNYRILKVLGARLTPQTREKLVSYAEGIPPKIFHKHFPANISSLRDKGFSVEDLSRLPIVLCHESSALEERWQKLWSEDEFRRDFDVDKLLALNKLQYSLEKHGDFRHEPSEKGEPTEVAEFRLETEEGDGDHDDKGEEKYFFDYGQICASLSR